MKTITLFAAAVVSLFAAYTYYYTDTFTSINLTNWTQNGSLTAGASGLQPGNPDGGSLISRIAPPGGGQAYEIWTALNMNNTGGSFVHYLRASDDARLGPVESGSFFAVEARNLQGQGQGDCAMELRIWSRIGGITTLLSTAQTGCYANTTMRTVISGAGLFQNTFMVYLGELDAGGTSTKAGSETPFYQSPVMTLAGGRPGVGAFGTPNGNAITRVHLGPPDVTPPSDPSEFKTTALPQSVDFQWRGSVDDANGTGITWYHILRNGTFMAYVPPGIAWTDSTVSPGTNYTYHIVALDRHMNASNYVAVPVTTPPPGSIDQRKVGLRPLGSYWGAMGEQIDMQSGNLNFTVPLLMVKGRAGMAVPVSLSYNSQNWRQDAAGTWKLGRDVGNGFGWRLMAGSLTAHYTDWWTVHHYTFADASGAEYRLDVNTNGVWTSTEPFYGRYVTAENRLFFPDGSFWDFGSVALGSEEDAGTRYPTLIQDSNGNQIIFRYRTGSGAPPGNTSSRIHQIEDPRASSSGGSTYGFTYDPQGPRRVLSIANYIGTSENYSFTYAPTAPTVSPFDSGLSIGTARTLSSITTSVGSYSLTYGSNNSGELTKVTLPSGGELEWQYQDFQYLNGKKFREVSRRWARANPSATRYEWQLVNDAGDTSRDVHDWRWLGQPGGDSSKVWLFNTTTGQNTTGLAYRFDDRAEPNNGCGLIEKHLLFSSDSGGRPYVSEILTKLNPCTPHVKHAKVEQTIDTWGNLTQQKLYAHDEWVTPERTLNYTYLTGSEYSSRYIRNRVTQVQLTPAGKPTVTLASYTYDPSYPKPLSADGIRQHDSSKNGDFRWRGNVREVVSLGAPTQTFLYDIGGNVVQVSGGSAASNTTMGSGQNYLVPTAITPHADASLTSSFQYEPGFLRIQSATGPNADQASFTYDALARPASTTSPHGATTQYTYTGLESTTATANGKWTKTTRDGFGRTVKVESGHGSTTVSLVETEYAPCACSPLGRAWRVSMPRAPGGALHWTTYTYDAAGRTLSVTPPGNAGSTTYLYEGNTVKVTDPAGKWKKFETDAFGNLVQVSEPPATGVDPIVTTYEYNHFNKLTKVNMPRDGITQTRTFEYSTEGLLTKTIFPETGTTTFVYDSDKRLYQKNDNKGQRIQYEYDSHHRLQYIRRYPVAGGPEDENQRTTYVYGNNPSLANAGRLIQIRNGYREIDFDGGFTENFTYNTAGLILAKNINWNNTQTGGLTVSYTYDPEGRRTATTYPTHYVWNGSAYVAQAGRAFTYSYDAMGRPASMLEGATPVVSSVSYNVAGQITAMTRQYQWDTESRTYNPRGQLTRQTGFGVDISYTFSSTANDGRIQEREDHISGEKVLYQYDQLGRLISAATEGAGGWGLAWVFDGYGNLRQQNVTKGSLTGFSFSINASTNRINGQTYDANGNWTAQWPMYQTYDIENRISAVIGNQSQQNESYLYSGRNERMVVTRGTENGIKRLHFYGADGLLLGVYRLEIAEQTVYSFPVRLPDQERLYFGGRLMQIGGEWVATDRLGSVVRKGTTNYKYAPYGQEIGGATDNDTNKFATYTRDSLSGLDYALNRYYKPEWGRFTSPDPYQASGGPADPGSWNRYAYVGGDPVNFSDPEGLQSFSASGTWDGLPGRFEVSNVDCLTRVHMGFNSVAFCASAGGWVEESRPEPRGGTRDPECFAQLKYRHIDHIAGTLGATHAFWWVQDRFGNRHIVSAGPQQYDNSTLEYLEAWVVAGDSNEADHSGQRLAWNSGLSSQNCDKVDKLISTASAFPRRSIPYDPVLGPNSNSAARHFGVSAGFTPTAPPGAVGWGTGIIYPGL